ncbi:hypothetical protein [Planctomicrobium sp. SH664]|uniref:hypothetical protein n=1 Tax=Planctomicrobium sp. SH664 TaxID=3448125 RepID=UPI003F5BD625
MPSLLRNTLFCLSLSVILPPLCWSSGVLLAAEPQASALLEIVTNTSNALIDNGRDRWGPEQTAMIASVMDRKTLAPPSKLPSGSVGVRNGDRTTPFGSNVNMQQNFFRTFYLLSQVTGDSKYTAAADAALLDFIRRAQSSETGLVGWGEHLSYDMEQDKVAAVGDQNLIHEPKKPLIFWDYLYQHEPERMLTYATGIWKHQIQNHETGEFSRHARFDIHKPGKGYDFTKEAGHFIGIWSKAYQASRQELYGEAVSVLTQRYQKKLNDRNLLDYDSVRTDYCNNGHNLTLACDLTDAAPLMQTYQEGQLSQRMQELATAIDRGFLSCAHRPDVPEAGFIATCSTATGESRGREGPGPEGYSTLWGMGYGRQGTAMVALHCFRRARQLGTSPDAAIYRQLALAAADCYARTGAPDPEIDVWPVEYGTVILMFLEAYKQTGDRASLLQARRRADEAVQTFWDETSPLPKCSTHAKHFETITGAETLVLALLAVHVAETDPKLELPFSDIDR